MPGACFLLGPGFPVCDHLPHPSLRSQPSPAAYYLLVPIILVRRFIHACQHLPFLPSVPWFTLDITLAYQPRPYNAPDLPALVPVPPYACQPSTYMPVFSPPALFCADTTLLPCPQPYQAFLCLFGWEDCGWDDRRQMMMTMDRRQWLPDLSLPAFPNMPLMPMPIYLIIPAYLPFFLCPPCLPCLETYLTLGLEGDWRKGDGDGIWRTGRLFFFFHSYSYALSLIALPSASDIYIYIHVFMHSPALTLFLPCVVPCIFIWFCFRLCTHTPLYLLPNFPTLARVHFLYLLCVPQPQGYAPSPCLPPWDYLAIPIAYPV